MKNNNKIVNALTIDVEDYFQVSAFSKVIKKSDWDKKECRIEKNVEKILEILSLKKIKATFFTLGWIAERYPSIILRIANEGHEIASHGYGHDKVTDLSRDDFYQDIYKAKNILEEISGKEILGYRAPSFSINAGNLWALETLFETGHRYSSSIYPIRHDHYGFPDSPRFPYVFRNEILEIPLTTVRIFKRNFPASGGGYFRLLPYSLSKLMIKNVNDKENKPVIFYFHPWEIDTDQPKISGLTVKSKLRHYTNIEKMESKIKNLTNDFAWDRVDNVFLNK